MKLLNDTLCNIKDLDRVEMEKRRNHINSLLKTPFGLGRLEDISVQLAGMDSCYKVNKKAAIVMAADNGVEKEGVSMGARIVTYVVADAMINGRASISSLTKTMGGEVFVVDLGIDNSNKIPGIIDKVIMKNGTNNIRYENAMTREEAIKAIESGIEVVDNLVSEGYNLIGIGELGMGNTSTSSAILHVLTGLPFDDIVGRGSGIDDIMLEHKKMVVEDAVKINMPYSDDPVEVLHKLGGLDIAAMTGAYLSAAKNRIPVVVDGFISGIAALLAYKMNPLVKNYMIPSHLSEEIGAKWIMKELELEPYLYFNMKLGEGSGAVLMFPMVEASVNIAKDIALYII